MRASRPTPVEANQLILRARISRAADGGQGQVTGLEVRSECSRRLRRLVVSPNRFSDEVRFKSRRGGAEKTQKRRRDAHSLAGLVALLSVTMC